MVFISILFCLLLKTGVQIVSDGRLTELWNVKTLVANFCLLFAGYPHFGMLGINNPVWYICILIQCYIMYYLIEWLLNKVSANEINFVRVCIYTFVVIVSFVTFRLGFLNEASFRGITSFSIGILICLGNKILSDRNIVNDKNRKSIGLISLVLTLALCGVVFLGINQRWVLQFLVFPVFVWIVAWLMWKLLDLPLRRKTRELEKRYE